MTFIATIEEERATGATATMYQEAEATHGYVPNIVKAFSHRPAVMAAWAGLLGSVKGTMDPRRYELVTMAAAKALHSSYCLLAHGSVLLRDHYGAEDLKAIVEEPGRSGLDDRDKAIMALAEKVVRDATSVNETDVATLRRHGLSDAEIFDVVAAAAVRCFFSKTLDALGALPDAAYGDMDAGLKDALAIGRPIAPEA